MIDWSAVWPAGRASGPIRQRACWVGEWSNPPAGLLGGQAVRPAAGKMGKRSDPPAGRLSGSNPPGGQLGGQAVRPAAGRVGERSDPPTDKLGERPSPRMDGRVYIVRHDPQMYGNLQPVRLQPLRSGGRADRQRHANR